ncbi:helix-turn-helix domain-containing protein [Flagellimonas myxillae]|uniref:helix-turn-helix domain-containing protein n=1 Tax=Flagellimonas myxillae TaxID=2942214 RepID=UPI00201EFBB9|nr:helix-turn-helix domain-containing protein [Muricauda myxillae]MCL6264914.1 helix-turn-helix domain-containing protein [Muricauda myxillae]
MKNLKFEDLPNATEVILGKLYHLEKELVSIKENFQPKVPVELMTRQETADYFKVDMSTLYNWTKKGKLIAYGIGGRVYYKRSEIMSGIVRFQ